MKTFYLLCSLLILGSGNNIYAQACPELISCRAIVNIALDQVCEAQITPEQLLISPCPTEIYSMVIRDADGNIVPLPITGEYIDQILTASITAFYAGEECEISLLIEDKMAPPLNYFSYPTAISCEDDLSEVVEFGSIDNCGEASFYVSNIEYVCNECSTDEVNITWVVTDDRGNTKTVVANIEYIDFCAFVTFPDDVTIDCPVNPNEYPAEILFEDPPFICARTLNVDFTDTKVGCTIRRLFVITDVCTGLSIEHTQLIEGNDMTPPIINEVFDEDISFDDYYEGWIPVSDVSDNCGDAITIVTGTEIINEMCDPLSFDIAYEVTAYDECYNSSTATGTVHVSAASSPLVSLNGSLSCDGPFEIETTTSQMIGPFSYSFSSSNPTWTVTDVGGGKALVNPARGATFITVDVTDSFGCTASEDIRFRCTGRPSGRSIGELKLYPNPVSDFLHIEIFEGIDKIEIYNLEGKLMITNTSIAENIQTIDLSEIISGIYLIKIYSSDNIETKKFSKM